MAAVLQQVSEQESEYSRSLRANAVVWSNLHMSKRMSEVCFAGGKGIEPLFIASKAIVRPLDDPPIANILILPRIFPAIKSD